MNPNIVSMFSLAFLFLISTQIWMINAAGGAVQGGGGGGGGRKTADTSSPPPASEGSGSAHGPNWDANWGWGSTPGGGQWSYGAAATRSPGGSGGSGFGFGWGGGGGGGGAVGGFGGVGNWADFLNALGGGGVSDIDPNTDYVDGAGNDNTPNRRLKIAG
ncbi:OLC1v1035758C1 [Oldenlandia corymbosa var. corymbosa]|uniref:OLC1v1035758C1 n=1 Tax=Oldenlandia corymbosa var. corymbosa TaxID=529605 RepID=A0AAV1CTS3_OLDCO|nr:OLC1v1035758C1 [Oldenlandia corymbosa var. corymbosa]